MPGTHDGTVQPDPGRLAPAIQFAVVDLRRGDVLLRRARYGVWQEPADQESSDGRVAVREMHIALAGRLPSVMASRQVGEHAVGCRLEIHALKPWPSHLPREQRRQRVDTGHEAAGAGLLVEPEHLGVDLHEIEQEGRVAHRREAHLLFRRGEAGQIIGRARRLKPEQVVPSFRREWRPRQELAVEADAPGRRLHEAVLAPGLSIEEVRCAESHPSVQPTQLRIVRREPVQVDADVFEELPGGQVVALGRLDVQGAAVEYQRAAVVLELVPLGMAAEVVVIVEDEDPGGSADVFDEEVRGRQPADPTANHHEVVLFARVDRIREVPFPPIAKLVSHLEGALVAATHAGEGRRVVVARLRCEPMLTRKGDRPAGHHECSANRDGEALDEIAPGDLPIHPEIAVALRHRGSFVGCWKVGIVAHARSAASWSSGSISATLRRHLLYNLRHSDLSSEDT